MWSDRIQAFLNRALLRRHLGRDFVVLHLSQQETGVTAADRSGERPGTDGRCVQERNGGLRAAEVVLSRGLVVALIAVDRILDLKPGLVRMLAVQPDQTADCRGDIRLLENGILDSGGVSE